MTGFVAALQVTLGPKGVFTGSEAEHFETDFRRMFRGAPLCVARPTSMAEVAATVTAEAVAAIWELRECITEAEAREDPSAKHDISVPLTVIPGFLRRLPAVMAGEAPAARPNVFGHLGDSNLRANALLSPGCNADAITRAVHDLTHDLGGSIAAEHGLDQYRVAEFMRLTIPAERRLPGPVRVALDPRGRMNSSKGAHAARGAG